MDTQQPNPYRLKASRLIEEIIEPIMGREIDDKEYHALEDSIVSILRTKAKVARPKIGFATKNQ